ncbi:lysophospholipid acyltransferase family protein [Phenylobacterium montanum]|uniref:1-acyl-sn-glycerol-3-phosphate acyltransferase n=1 Tax=Phenylobacterium montanum TaxID=2823693 RepID=A0A975FY01_9CAUL|nr:lysophospholipid acyltransferase family protein [Caulobacter sp. S6]QUD86918.1 1-acyl-sn-glycerol-3-phosphate acyltransferase [Caulobacter sp. S6]
MILIRSLLFTLVFYLWSVIMCLLLVPTLVGPRHWLTFGFKVWSTTTIALLRVICGVRVEIRGRQHLPHGAALIAAKHQCMLDTVVPFTLMDDACLVLKKELTRIPFYGWYCLRGKMIVVDREAQAAALRKLVTDSRARMAEQRQLMIFPEGHRMEPGAAPDYKPGVAALYRDLDMPCVPMATNSGVHWPAHGIIRRPGVVVFEFLEPIPAGLKRGAFMAELQNRVEAASNALLEAGI